MFRMPLSTFPEALPESVTEIIRGCPVFDSSCSPNARVYFIDSGPGLFLKSAPAGTLREEARMTQYFHSLQLGPEVISYETASRDYLLTSRIPGEDCLHPDYLANPERLCDTLAATLRQLHDTPAENCPVTHHTPDLSRLEKTEILPRFDSGLYLGACPFLSAEAAWDTLTVLAPVLQSEVLIHGDYCLPNVMLDGWQFSGFIDLGGAGFGNRHRDLFWGLWSLCYNLKTDRYTERFLDAYGRNLVNTELLRAVAAAEGFSIT